MSFRVKSNNIFDKSKKQKNFNEDNLYQMNIDNNRILYYDQIQKFWVIKIRDKKYIKSGD